MTDVTLPPIITVEPWLVPDCGETRWPIRSKQVELFWLPVLGPSAIALLRRLDLIVTSAPRPVTLEIEELGSSLGLRRGFGRSGLLERTVERCIAFRAIREQRSSCFEVRQHLPALNQRQIRRLPPALRRLYTESPDFATYRLLADSHGRIHQLVSTLIELEVPYPGIVEQLEGLGYPADQIEMVFTAMESPAGAASPGPKPAARLQAGQPAEKGHNPKTGTALADPAAV